MCGTQKFGLVLGATILAGIVVFALVYALDQGLFITWKSLGTPPDQAVQIVEVDWSTVWVETSAGDVLSCNLDELENCWSSFLEYPEHLPALKNERFPQARVPDQPRGAQDFKEVYVPFGPAHLYAAYAIALGGEVLAWRYTASEWTGLKLVVYPIVGMLVTFLFLVLAVSGQSRRSNISNYP